MPYVPIGDLDPRVVDDLLATLRDRGIAAYAEPVDARPLTRLYVDDRQVDQARTIVDAATAPSPEEADFESSWQQVLVSLQSSPTHLENPWPEAENLTLTEREAAYDEQQAMVEPEEHYVPPPPPPLPRLRPATYGALATMALCVGVMLTNMGGRSLNVLAFVVFVAAAASLVYNMRQGPPMDDDSDDGAVV
jgi:hypothetical protein